MKCKHCEEILRDNEWYATALDGEPICESCESQSWQNACVVYEVENGEVLKYEWCPDFGFRDGDYCEITTSPDSVEGFKYVRTDGWRGYYDSIIANGYTAVASGWCTDKHDDVAYKHLYNDLVDAILGGKVSCPYKIVFAFAPTSNVFSTASDLIIEDTQLDNVKRWMEEQLNVTEEQIQNALK